MLSQDRVSCPGFPGEHDPTEGSDTAQHVGIALGSQRRPPDWRARGGKPEGLMLAFLKCLLSAPDERQTTWAADRQTFHPRPSFSSLRFSIALLSVSYGPLFFSVALGRACNYITNVFH